MNEVCLETKTRDGNGFESESKTFPSDCSRQMETTKTRHEKLGEFQSLVKCRDLKLEANLLSADVENTATVEFLSVEAAWHSYPLEEVAQITNTHLLPSSRVQAKESMRRFNYIVYFFPASVSHNPLEIMDIKKAHN